MSDYNTKQKISKILAWIGLVIITVLLCIIAYAMATQNGKLALAMTIVLIFISILFWIGIKLYKDMIAFENLKHKKEEQQKMNEIASMDTKKL